MGGLEPRTGRGARGKLSTGAVDKSVDKSPLGPGSKRIRPGLTSNPGLPRGEPGADKNVKPPGPKIGLGQNTSRGFGLRPHEVRLAAREGAARTRPVRTSNAKRLVVAQGVWGRCPQRPLQQRAAARCRCACPAAPVPAFSGGTRRVPPPGWSAPRSRGVRGRAAPAANRALHWVPEGMLLYGL